MSWDRFSNTHQAFQGLTGPQNVFWFAKKIDRVKHNKGLIVILTFQSKLKQAMQMHQSLQL
jgi:hypothetical protein